MSGLKAYIAPTPDGTGLADYYLKSEADKVITHQKYKRCLAMAMWCKEKSVSPFFLGEKDLWRFTSNYWMRWQQRWLVLAEKFKEVK